MKRRDFLKAIGIGATASVLSVEASVKGIEFPKSTDDWGEVTHTEIIDTAIDNMFDGDITLALFTSELGADGIGDEVSYNGYERQPVTFNTGYESVSNNVDVVFPEYKGIGIVIKSVGVYRGENMLFFENYPYAITEGKTFVSFPIDNQPFLQVGDTLSFQKGNVNISMD